MNLPVISLFSGAMGLDLGLMKAGLQVKVSVDFDKDVGKTLTKNNHPHIIGDIRGLIENDPSCGFLLDKANIKKEELFAVVGGPPCQAFSVAGKRQGINDPRGTLFKEFVHVVKELQPRFFVMENVNGLLSSKVYPDKKDDTTTAYDLVLEAFHELGYKTVSGLLNSINYGTPQFRERLIIIGSRDHEDIFLPYPTHFQHHQKKEYRWKTIKEAWEGLEENEQEYLQLSEDRLNILKKVPEGGNWKDLEVADQKLALGGAFTSGGGKTGFYRRLRIDEPSPTLVTSPIQKSSLFGHPFQHRPLSVREYARIQQFPDDWNIEGSLYAQYRQIGNAVPVGLGKAIGEVLFSLSQNNHFIHTRRIKSNPILKKLDETLYIQK